MLTSLHGFETLNLILLTAFEHLLQRTNNLFFCRQFKIMHHKIKKIGTQCVHVSAIWKLNNHMGNKAMHASQTKDICVLSPRLLGFTVDVGKPGI